MTCEMKGALTRAWHFVYELEAPALGSVSQVRGSAQHMAELIESLLTLARVTQSKIRHERAI